MSWVELRSKPLSYHRRRLKTGYPYIENERGKSIALSPAQRAFLGRLSRGANLPRFVRRWLLGKIAVRSAPGHVQMHNGYAMIPAVAGHEAMVALCEKQMKIYKAYQEKGRRALIKRGIDPEAYEREIAKTADDPLKHIPCHYDPAVIEQMLAFALQPALVATAARYLGVLPVLAGVRLLYSPNEDGALDRAQLFHLDPEGARQAKGFMAVRPVGPQNSPFTFVPADRSEAMLRSGQAIYTAKRVPDKYIHRMAPADTWISHTGEPGDALFVDTSRCFHFGSRPNEEPRFLFYFSFLDPFSSFYPILKSKWDAPPLWRDLSAGAAPYADDLLGRRL